MKRKINVLYTVMLILARYIKENSTPPNKVDGVCFVKFMEKNNAVLKTKASYE